MPLPQPALVNVHAVLGVANPAPMDPARDDRFIEAVRPEFPNVLTRQFAPPGQLVFAPHLVLASSSAQLAVSIAQADFEVRFYGDYSNDLDRAFEYVDRKVSSIRHGFEATDQSPSIIGMVATLHFSCAEVDGRSPAEHVQATLLNTQVPADELQDALARVALKVRNTYFVTLTVGNFETRVLQRPVIPGVAMRVRPWEGDVEDQGIELAIDINNNLEARVQRQDPIVTEEGIRAVTRTLREIATTTGPAFVERGELPVAALVAVAQP